MEVPNPYDFIGVAGILFVVISLGLVVYEMWLNQQKFKEEDEKDRGKYLPRDPENLDPYGPNNPPVR